MRLMLSSLCFWPCAICGVGVGRRTLVKELFDLRTQAGLRESVHELLIFLLCLSVPPAPDEELPFDLRASRGEASSGARLFSRPSTV